MKQQQPKIKKGKEVTAMQVAIKMLEDKRAALKEMDLLGVLLPNEYSHKSNEINSIQISLSKLLPKERCQIINAWVDGGKMISSAKSGEGYFNQTYKQLIK